MVRNRIADIAGDAGATERRRPSRKIVICAVIGVIAIAGTVGVSGVNGAFDREQASAADVDVDVSTVAVEFGDLEGTKSVAGTLAYAAPRDLATQISGVLTAMAPPGEQIGLGGILYTVDNNPVRLMFGGLPAWREFASGMRDGPDIQQLESSLAALGHFTQTPDTRFSAATTTAIKKWQKETNQVDTRGRASGTIEFGRIHFEAAEIRVAGTTASLGSSVGPGTPVITISSIVKTVTVNLNLNEQSVAGIDQAVVVELPGGAPTAGKVTAVGLPAENEGTNGQKVIQVPVTIELAEAEAAAELQQASVIVKFPSESRTGVLSLPVEAFIALSGGRYGVEIARPNGSFEKVPVELGLFAGGRVEFSGKGISPGDDAVVPTR